MDRYALDLPGYGSDPDFRPVLCPYDREPIAEVAFASQDALAHALEVAAKTKASWGRTPLWRRAEILRKAADLIRADQDSLAMLIASEGGKPLQDARVEATRAAVTLESCAEAALHLEGQEMNMQRAPGTEGRVAFTVREPIGVVLAVCAFNHPLNLACHQAGAAIAGGNVCILKPASSTPVSSIRLYHMLREAGLPEGVLQITPAAGRDASILVESPIVNFITFIGSADVGWKLRRQAAPGTRMAAEHGGNAASIVLDDADLDRAIPLLTRGAFYHAGQVCVSTQRIYATPGITGALTERLVAAAKDLVCGDAREAVTDVGPLIEPEEVTRVAQWVDEAKAAGAGIVLGGEAISETVYGTTILANAPEDSHVIAHEVFGPVVTIQPTDGLDDAIEKVNRSENPFQSSIFTQDIDRAFRAARAIDAATYMINDLTAFRVDWMPFGGRKNAGLGMGGTDHGVHEMTEEKLIVMNVGPR